MRAHGVGDGLYAVEPMKAVICFTFDDGNATDSDIYEMFKERGMVCSFALNTSGPAKDRLAQYLPYQAEGFEILSHSVSHAEMEQQGKSSIWVEKGDRRVNAKSLLGVLSLGIVQDMEITLLADGEDENEALEGLIELINTAFGE